MQCGGDALNWGVRSLLGFTLYHTPAHIARALYEGVAYALAGCAGILGECGLPVKSLMLVGGGAKSVLWADMLASMIGVPTRIHAYPASATSLGAAIAAGVGVGLFDGYELAALVVRVSSEHIRQLRVASRLQTLSGALRAALHLPALRSNRGAVNMRTPSALRRGCACQERRMSSHLPLRMRAYSRPSRTNASITNAIQGPATARYRCGSAALIG